MTMDTQRSDFDLERRVGAAWREMRRGASAARIKELFYETDGVPVDIALADTLSLVCQNGRIQDGLTHILSEFKPAEQQQLADFFERFVEAVVHYIDAQDAANPG